MYEIDQAKVTMLGNANAGKSSIIQRFIMNSFQDHSNPTIGATFLSKVIDFDRKSIKLSI
jgi:GTPase SAR1 and related small G proteins